MSEINIEQEYHEINNKRAWLSVYQVKSNYYLCGNEYHIVMSITVSDIVKRYFFQFFFAS